MDHVAIMTPSWKLIPKILSGEKSIESRWYQTRRAPWDTISVGDRVFFKDSGTSITARAIVSNVWQFEIGSIHDAEKIVREFGTRIALVNSDVKTWGKLPRYCILIELADPESVSPFDINKRGFGSGAAWITLDSIDNIRL
jgi:hypothetical protein